MLCPYHLDLFLNPGFVTCHWSTIHQLKWWSFPAFSAFKISLAIFLASTIPEYGSRHKFVFKRLISRAKFTQKVNLKDTKMKNKGWAYMCTFILNFKMRIFKEGSRWERRGRVDFALFHFFLSNFLRLQERVRCRRPMCRLHDIHRIGASRRSKS